MAQTKLNQRALTISTAAAAWFLFWSIVMLSNVSFAERLLKDKEPEHFVDKEDRQGFLIRMVHFLWQGGKSAYEHVWPVSIICVLSSV
jgi:uncharacterized membrane protein SpoIIM required for sporulation